MSLKTNEGIQVFLGKLQMVLPEYHLTAQQIRQPTSEVILSFLDRFLTALNVNCDLLHREALKQVEHPDSYKDIMYVIIIYRQMITFIEKSNLTNYIQYFKFGSLLAPTPKFVHWLLPFCINFLMFQNTFKTFDNVYEKCKAEALAVEQVRKFEEEVRIAENNAAIKQSTLEAYMVEYQKKKNELLAEEQENLAKITEKDRVIENLRSQKSVLDEKAKMLEAQLQSAEAEKKKIREFNSLVAEKESLATDIKKLQVKSDEMTSLLKLKKIQESVYQKKIDVQLLSEANMMPLDAYKAGEEHEREVVKLKQELNNLNATSQSNAAKMKCEDSTITAVQEEFKALELRWKEKKTMLEKEFNTLKEDNVLFESKNKSVEEELGKLAADLEDMKKKIENYEEIETKIKQHWLKNYSKILESNKALLLKYKKYSDGLKKAASDK